MQNNISILIDGSNFYFKLKDLNLIPLVNFNFGKFSTSLIRKNETIFERIFYIGAVKTDGTKKMQKLHSDQQKLFQHLVNNKYKYKLGYLLKSKDKFSEKGVDVNIASDILIQSYEKKVKTIYLVSSDTDLIPAIIQAKKLKVEIVYVGFKHLSSKALINKCSRSLLLDSQGLKAFSINK